MNGRTIACILFLSLPARAFAREGEATVEADVETWVAEAPARPITKKMLHGFRLGFGYIAHGNDPDPTPSPNAPDQTVLESLGMRSPSTFLIGYEAFYRLVGHSWLNVLLVGNVMVMGIEQSKFLPSGNMLIGFELDEQLQLGVGMNLTPERDKVSHMIAALGWTPQVGSFHVPFHLFFVPDVDRNHRMGATIGVNW